jgi:hypothetical protein
VQAALYSLIPLADFKAILSIDDREGALSRYCLITALTPLSNTTSGGWLKKLLMNN